MAEQVAFGIAEIEDDDRIIPIENSHLSWGRCSCGARALFDPQSVPAARCGGCLMLAAEKAEAPEPVPGLPRLGQGHPPAPPVEHEPYPEPEISSRDPLADVKAPAAVTRLAGKAGKLGWQVKVQRSRGCLSHATTGRPGKVRDLWAVIVAKAGAGAYAVRDEESWTSVMLWGTELPWFPGASVTQLEEYLAADGRMPAAWFEAIRGKSSASAARSKARAACNRGVHPSSRALPIPGPLRVTYCDLCGNGWRTGGDPWRAPKKGREGLS